MLRFLIIIIGVILGVLLAKLIAKQILRKKPYLPKRDALKRGLLTVAGAFTAFAFIFSVGNGFFALKSEMFPPPQYDISEYIQEDLPTNPAVWCISDGENSLYMLGTIHATVTGKTFPLPDWLMDIYDKCDKIIVESHNPQPAKSDVYEEYKLPDGSKITDMIDFTTYDSCKAFLTERKAYYPEMDSYNTDFWYNLMMSVELQNVNGIDLNMGVDNYFKALAEKDGKEIIPALGNENYSNTMSSDLQEYLLSELVSNPDKTPIDFASLYIDWASGNVENISEVNLDGLPEALKDDYEKYLKSVLIDRNVIYADKIIEALKKGENAFVMFGTAHFGGEKGIISLIRAKGYEIRQIN